MHAWRGIDFVRIQDPCLRKIVTPSGIPDTSFLYPEKGLPQSVDVSGWMLHPDRDKTFDRYSCHA